MPRCLRDPILEPKLIPRSLSSNKGSKQLRDLFRTQLDPTCFLRCLAAVSCCVLHTLKKRIEARFCVLRCLQDPTLNSKIFYKTPPSPIFELQLAHTPPSTPPRPYSPFPLWPKVLARLLTRSPFFLIHHYMISITFKVQPFCIVFSPSFTRHW